jgi:hypothetical protein
MHVQAWFSDPAQRASRRIDFDKSTQQFDTNAASRLLKLADPHGRAHVTIAEHREEELTSNLLRVDTPDVLYSAPTKAADPPAVWDHLKGSQGRVRDDFMLRGGRLYTWQPAEALGLADLVTGPTDVIETPTWADPADPVRQRALVQLLNRTLREDVSADCAWHAKRRVIYFRATEDFRPRRILSASNRPRLVFNPKFKQSAPDEISYCQHAALEWQFLHLDGHWLCALTPTYHYTRDGHRDSLYLSDLLKGIKQRERNAAVYHLTRMWATFLHSDDDLLGSRPRSGVNSSTR